MWRAVLLSGGLLLAGCAGSEVPPDAIKYEYPPPSDTSEWGPPEVSVVDVKAVMLSSGQVQVVNEGRVMDEVLVDGDLESVLNHLGELAVSNLVTG